MLKDIKKTTGLLVSILIVVYTLTCSLQVNAAGSDLTSQMKKEKGIKKITENMCFFPSTLYCMNEYKANKVIHMKMNASNNFYIAGFLTCIKYNKINYSKRKYFIVKGNTVLRVPVNMKYASKLYKNLFGETLKMSKVRQISTNLIIRNKKGYASYGEFGEEWPSYSIESITKTGANTYQIRAENKLVSSMPFPDGRTSIPIGTTWITVKKDGKSSYGYKVTKFSYKLTP